MNSVDWQLHHYKDLGASGTPNNVITDFSNITIVTTTGDGRDNTEFRMKDHLDVTDEIEVNDKIEISRTEYGDSFGQDDLIMTAATTNVPTEVTASEAFTRVECENYSKTIMEATAFVDARELRIDEALQQALQSVQSDAPNFGVTWHPNNPSTKQTEPGEYPKVGERWYNKRMSKLLQDYSKDSRTKDGDYYWYVDSQNRLVWRPETGTVDQEIDDDFPYKNLSVDRSNESVVNFVLVKGGTLPTGEPIEAKYKDFASMGKNGPKRKDIQGRENYVDNLHGQTMNNIGAAPSDTRPSEVSGFSYPMPVSDVAWQTDTQITSDDDYFDRLKSVVKDELRKDGAAVVDNDQNGYYKITLEVHANDNVFGLSDVYQFSLSRLRPDLRKEYRVEEVEYTSTIDRIIFKEDRPTV